MCLSAPVSFVASGVLTATGVATIKRKPLRRERLFATIPFLFAIQQAIEGVQWLVLRKGAVSLPLGYAFLFFAFLVWPIYIPLAVLKMERNKKHAHILRWFLFAGIAVTVYLLIILLKQPLDILVAEQSIKYLINVPLSNIGIFIYVIVVSGSLLASSDQHVRWFGWATTISFFVALFFFHVTFISTWCFFAAALSFMLYSHFRKKAHQRRKTKR